MIAIEESILNTKDLFSINLEDDPSLKLNN